jgi:molybdopterin biosynthesis enzyme
VDPKKVGGTVRNAHAVKSFVEPPIVVHGIRVKPGKVAGFGVVGGKPEVVLPELLVSLTGFCMIHAVLIGLCNGLKNDKVLPVINAKINQDLQLDARRLRRFLPVHVSGVNGPSTKS